MKKEKTETDKKKEHTCKCQSGGMCCRNCGRQTLEQVKDTVVCDCCGASGPAL